MGSNSVNLSNIQLISLYDSDPRMTVDILASTMGCEPEAVKCVLAAGSRRYKEELKLSEGNLLTEDDRAIAANAIRELAQFAENEGVKLKAAMTILDRDKKGDDKRILATTRGAGTININILNQYIQKGREQLKRAKAVVTPKQQEAITV